MSQTAPEAGTRTAHNCQTPGCPSDFRLITFDVETGETTFLCMSDQLAFWLAVTQAMADNGTLNLELPAGAPSTP